jgi:hypothetical protein
MRNEWIGLNWRDMPWNAGNAVFPLGGHEWHPKRGSPFIGLLFPDWLVGDCAAICVDWIIGQMNWVILSKWKNKQLNSWGKMKKICLYFIFCNLGHWKAPTNSSNGTWENIWKKQLYKIWKNLVNLNLKTLVTFGMEKDNYVSKIFVKMAKFFLNQDWKPGMPKSPSNPNGYGWIRAGIFCQTYLGEAVVLFVS